MSTASKAVDAMYGKLLSDFKPRTITSSEQLEEYAAEVSKLVKKGANRTAEETEFMRLLVTLCTDYEAAELRQTLKDTHPKDVLEFLLEQNGLTQSAFEPTIPQSRISEILAGKRLISRKQAAVMGEFFKIPSSVFI